MAVRNQRRAGLLDEALAHGGPIIVFDGVNLSFDDKVILRDVSFTLQTGHTKVFLGASGAGKSTILRLILGLLKPDAGRIFVNGEEIEDMAEEELMRSEEHTSELQSHSDLVCRLLLEKKNKEENEMLKLRYRHC